MTKKKQAKEPTYDVRHWLNEIQASRKREKDFRKDGQDILDIYVGDKKDTTPFNILYSNTETLLPALYSAVPRPVVQRRFKDEDPLGKYAAEAGQRVLEFLLDTNIEGYETFDEGMRSATLDALLPGRGVTCIKYDVETGDIPPPEGSAEGTESTPYKQSELVCADSRSWDRVYFGYAKKWSKVPWLAYEEHLDKKECTRLFGKEIADKLVYTDSEDDDEKDDEDRGERKTVMVYQIWDRAGGKKIRYISPQYAEGFLKVDDDLLELTGFYNCPKPLTFLPKSNDLMPVALYCMYENQAKELNELTRRISRIAKAIKARGVYDTELGDDIKKLFEADDNEMVPADHSSSIASEKGLQNAIWFAPIDVLIVTLEKLLLAREKCKQVIYEITGIADIMRGASQASETLGAQKIKESWGTLRLKKLQKEVQRYARDMLRMMLEIAATKFSEETWAKMTGLPFVTTEKRQQLDLIAQASQTSGQPLDPQTQQKLQAPVWGQVLKVLRDDTQRAYRIDIETNSTVEPEAVEDQKNISEVMTALGQFLNSIGPLIAKGVMPFQAAQSMMLAIVRRYRFGPEIEDYIKQMQPPKPEDNGEQQKQAQKEMQAMQDKMTMQSQLMQATQRANTAEMENKLRERETALDVREIKLNSEQQVFDLKKQMADKDLSQKSAVENHKLNSDRKIASLENSKFKTENVVNKKADDVMGKGVTAMQGVVQSLADLQSQLLQVVAQQTQENKESVLEIVKAVKAPRKRTAVRDKNNRIVETVEESMN